MPGGVCKVWLKFLADVSFLYFNIWVALISELLVRLGWITFHRKDIMFLFSNIIRLTTFHLIYLLTSAYFHQFQERYVMWHHSTSFNSIWCFWYTYWPPMGYQYVDLSAVQKLEEKCFPIKIWIIAKKICLLQQKMNGNYAIIWYFGRTTQ